MRRLHRICLLGSVLAMLGCTYCPLPTVRNPLGGVGGRLLRATQPARQSWARVSGNSEPIPQRNWHWKSGIPTGVPRAELFAASIPARALNHFVPELPAGGIRLASTHSPSPTLRVANIEGMQIDNYNDFYLATNRAVEAAKTVQVDLLPEVDAANSPSVSIDVEPEILVALSQVASDHQVAMRIVEEGNLWALVRDGGVQAKLTVRVEREQALLQVVLSLVNCWGEQRLLPADVRASCDGVPLRCLTVAQTLEALYGSDEQIDAAKADEQSYSFAAISEREDYLIPFNYEQLVERIADERAVATGRPAFASFAGIPYPGPAILGDARALSGFLLQRALHGAESPERTGWIIFEGDALRTGSQVVVAIDLGRGSRSFAFQVP